MTIRIGINGFGRIGRNLVRALGRNSTVHRDLEVVAINDLFAPEELVHFCKYDSVMGPYPGLVAISADGMSLDGHEVALFKERDPKAIPWAEVGVDYVIEASGLNLSPETAAAHREAGAPRVVLSAPPKGTIKTLVMGVNEQDFDPRDEDQRIVSNASCTTNCLAVMVSPLLRHYGIDHGFMNTVHAYTNDQRLLDSNHSDLRRARAAALSMIPTKTGASQAIGLVLPELQDKIHGMSVRVPTPNVSLVDVVLELVKPATADEINQLYQGLVDDNLGYTEEPLVSQDFQFDAHSAIVDGSFTRSFGRLVKVMGWYNNEWGYANRLLDLIRYMAAREAG